MPSEPRTRPSEDLVNRRLSIASCDDHVSCVSESEVGDQCEDARQTEIEQQAGEVGKITLPRKVVPLLRPQKSPRPTQADKRKENDCCQSYYCIIIVVILYNIIFFATFIQYGSFN